MYRSAVVFKVL